MEGVAQTLREMIPFLSKKRSEAEAVLDHLSEKK